jgi:hypothetical protein
VRVQPDHRIADASARLGVVAGLTGIDVGAIVAHLPAIARGLATRPRLATRADGHALALELDVPASARPQLAGLGPAADPIATLFAPAPAADAELELASDGTIVARLVGARSRTADLEAAAALGVATTTRDALGAILDRVPVTSPVSGSIAVRIANGATEVEIGRVIGSSEPVRAEALAAIDAVAAELGVTRAQRGLIGKVHTLLARGHAARLAVSATATALAPRVVLRYPQLPWEVALRFATGLHPDNTATFLGTFAGATGGDHVAWLELWLGTIEPPVVWIASA